MLTALRQIILSCSSARRRMTRSNTKFPQELIAKGRVRKAVAILSLSLGIGANTAIFSLQNALIFRPLPIRDPGKLVRLSTTTPANPDREGSLSLAMYQQIRKDQRVFSDLFAWD